MTSLSFGIVAIDLHRLDALLANLAVCRPADRFVTVSGFRFLEFVLRLDLLVFELPRAKKQVNKLVN